MNDKYLYSYTLHYPVLVADISSTAKLLYSIIWPLTTKYGYAWPTNAYLAKPLGLTEEGVRKCMRQLEDKGLIVTEVSNEHGKTVRKIWCTLPREAPPTNGGDGGATPTFVPERPQLLSQATPTNGGVHKKDECKHITQQVVTGADTASDEKDPVEAEVTVGYVMASALLELIRRNKKFYRKIERFFSTEKAERTSLKRWAKDFDLLLTRDAKEEEEAIRVLRWCQRDEFWQGQILSGSNFRKHYENLLSQMNGARGGNFGLSDEHPEVTDLVVRAYAWLCNNSNWSPNKHQMPKFIEAAERVVAFIDLHRDRNLTPEELVRYLRDCLQESWRDKGEMVHPGHMRSDHTWDVLLPQYLENVIGAL